MYSAKGTAATGYSVGLKKESSCEHVKEDAHYMRRALRLAERGIGRTSPNPLVGAVVVNGDTSVGEGAHLRLGQAHAEIHALYEAGQQARGATLYVTLEPCAHQGYTPPCCQAIISAGIVRVVCAIPDPDPRVAGRSIDALRAAGITVDLGLMSLQAERQNAAFLKHRRTGRPHVVLKLAQSLDGRIATDSGDSRWISNQKSRRLVHRWRARSDIVAVGGSTVIADDPKLDVRLTKGPNPRSLVVDGHLRVSPDARVFAGRAPILATADGADTGAFAARGVTVWTFPAKAGHIDMDQLAKRVGAAGLTSILIEGGGRFAATALEAGIVDRVMVFITPRIFGGGISAIDGLEVPNVARSLRLRNLRTRRLDDDLLYTAEVEYPCSPA